MKTKARGERRRIPHRGQEDGPEVATEGEEDVKPNYVRKKRSRNRKTDAKTKARKKVNNARTTRPSLSGRTGAGRTRGSRKAAKREREEGEAIPKRAKDQKTGTRMKKARKKERRVRRHYDLTAVFPLVKPRSWLNVKFRCSMISTLRSCFPTWSARGHTMGTPEDSPRMGCTHLNSRWRMLIFRVQLMSLEYNRKVSSMMSLGSQGTRFPSRGENVTRFNMKHTQRGKQRAKRTLHNRCRYVNLASEIDITGKSKGLRWCQPCSAPGTPR